MVISDIYKMNWMKGPIIVDRFQSANGRIINGDITPAYNSPLRKLYNPFEFYEVLSNSDSKNLYLKFISIDENSLEEIVSFVANYGLPGVYFSIEQSEHIKLQNYARQLESLLKKLDPAIKYNKPGEIKDLAASIYADFDIKYKQKLFHKRDEQPTLSVYEPIMSIIGEIKYFRCLVDLWKSIQGKNASGCVLKAKLLREYYRIPGYFELFAINPENKDNFDLVESVEEDTTFDVVIEQAFFRIFAGELNHKINMINPVLNYNELIPDNTEIAGSWNTPTLLHAMYLMFYLDITKKRDIVKCHNESCPKYFIVYGNYKNKIYCGHECANLQAQRRFQKKTRLGKNKTT